MVRCEEDRKKHTKDATMMDMNPPDYYLNVIMEYVIEIVWLRRLIVVMRYAFRLIFFQTVSSGSRASYIIIYNNIQNTQTQLLTNFKYN